MANFEAGAQRKPHLQFQKWAQEYGWRRPLHSVRTVYLNPSQASLLFDSGNEDDGSPVLRLVSQGHLG